MIQIPFLIKRYHLISNLGKEAPFFSVIFERRSQFIGYLREEAPFYGVNSAGGWCRDFLCMSNTCWRLTAFHENCHDLTWLSCFHDLIFSQLIKKGCNYFASLLSVFMSENTCGTEAQQSYTTLQQHSQQCLFKFHIIKNCHFQYRNIVAKFKSQYYIDRIIESSKTLYRKYSHYLLSFA